MAFKSLKSNTSQVHMHHIFSSHNFSFPLTKTIPSVLLFHVPNLSDFSKSFAKSSRGCSRLKNVSLGSIDNHHPKKNYQSALAVVMVLIVIYKDVSKTPLRKKIVKKIDEF